MILTLRVLSQQRQMMGRDAQMRFVERGGSIGRRAGNDWVLPDPERLISGQHALLEYERGSYYITDLSTNGSFVNDLAHPVGKGERVRLNHGDRLLLGDYVIEVGLESAQALPEMSGLELEEPSVGSLDQALGLPSGNQSDDTSPTRKNEQASSCLSADTGAAAGTQRDDLAGASESFTPPAAYTEAIPTNWDREFEGDATAEMPRPAGLDLGAGPAELPEGSISPASEPPPPPAPGTAVGSTAAGTQGHEAVTAFLQGAGVDSATLPPEQAVPLMGTVGQIVREAVKGLRETLMARTQFKRGFRMQQTIVRPVENNPLKFTVGDVTDTVRNLLFQESRGYLPPLEAVREGFEDLEDHQVAMVVGMKAALLSLLKRFDPQGLEEAFNEQGWHAPLLASSKKAKLWELYVKRYQSLSQDIEDDFQAVFGNEFVSAYEQQIRELARAREEESAVG